LEEDRDDAQRAGQRPQQDVPGSVKVPFHMVPLPNKHRKDAHIAAEESFMGFLIFLFWAAVVGALGLVVLAVLKWAWHVVFR
jgi:hypothetical protein